MTHPSAQLKAITLDDLMAHGEDAQIEVIDGEIVMMAPVGGLHQMIVGAFYYELETHNRAHPVGAVFPDGLIYLMHSDTRNLKDSFVPDVSFIRKGNIPSDWNISEPFPGVPDLAIEVASPGDSADEVVSKAHVYLDKGTEQVLVVYPEVREIHQYRRNQREIVRLYRGSQIIDLEAFFPGFELTAETIFKLPDWLK